MNKICYIITLLFLCSLFSCKKNTNGTIHVTSNDFEKIKQKGELTILTLNSSTSYFIYKEEPMGYYYDLARDFCDFHGLKLNVKIAENVTRLDEMLNNKEGDLIAYALPIQNEMKDTIIYCGLQQISHQVLVQRANKEDTILKDVTNLIGKNISVKANTKYYQRLMNLNSELGGGINIVTVNEDTITSEDMIKMVSLGKIKYTVSDEYIARLNKTYYQNINISLKISFDQRSSWAVRNDSPNLAKALDEWFSTKSNTPKYKSIVKKYFELSKQPIPEETEGGTSSKEKYVVPKDLPKGAISVYDDLFKKYAHGGKFDWHLLTAISYQECRFQNNLTSWAGASGIMGLMPKTAESLGLTSDERMDPELSIRAAVTYLGKLDKMFRKIEDKEERLKFVLASYNGGIGHIFDAQALARKHGADPYIWFDNAEKYLKLKNVPEYYNDSVCKSGYFRAGETVNYVKDVLANTQRFREISAKKH